MPKWSKQIEEELTNLLKDWLKHHGRTQADLKNSLEVDSSRMPFLLDKLKREYDSEGSQGVMVRLCEIEREWSKNLENYSKEQTDPKAIGQDNIKMHSDPFGQLDFLLQEIRDDCTESID